MEDISQYYKEEQGYSRKYYVLKPHIQKEFNNKLVVGDKVFVQHKNAKYSFKQLDEYLGSVGCTRIKDLNLADKIICDWNSYQYKSSKFYISVSTSELPTELPKAVHLRHKSVFWSGVESDIKTYIDNQRTRIEFDYSMYENFWNLLRSGKKDDVRLAAVGIMTADWANHTFLLKFLIINFSHEIRLGNLSSIPNWSDFANLNNLTWKNHTQYAGDVISLFADYIITEEQTKLINKLLNNN